MPKIFPNTLIPILIIFLLLPLTLSRPTQILDISRSSLTKFSNQYYRITLTAADKNCGLGINPPQQGWIVKGKDIFVPSADLGEGVSNFSIGVFLLDCKQDPNVEFLINFQRIEVMNAMGREEFWYEIDSVKIKSQSKKQNVFEGYILGMQGEQEERNVEEIFEEIMEVPAPEVKQNDPRNLAVGNIYSNTSQGSPIKSFEQKNPVLPTATQLQQMIAQNNTLQISITIQNSLHTDALPCFKKSSYLLEFAAYIYYHVQDLRRRISQLSIFIQAAFEDSFAIQQEIKGVEAQIKKIEEKGYAQKLKESYRKLEEGYVEGQVVRGKLEAVKAESSQVESLLSRLQSEKGYMLSIVEKIRILEIAQKYDKQLYRTIFYASISEQFVKHLKTLIQILKNPISTLESLFYTSKQNRLLLEVDISRLQEDYSQSVKQQEKLLSKLESLYSELFHNDIKIEQQEREMRPLILEIEQMTIYLDAIDEQIDLVYYSCMEIVPVKVQRQEEGVVIEIEAGDFGSYLQSKFNYNEQYNPQPTKPIKIYRTKSVALSDKDSPQRKGEFSCLEIDSWQTGFGIIRAISNQIIVIESAISGKESYALELARCSRVEVVGGNAPKVGMQAVWRGMREGRTFVRVTSIVCF